MRAIFSQKVILIPVFLFLLNSLSAQRPPGHGNHNFLNKQGKPYYFGLTLAFHSSNYNVFRGKNFNTQDQILSVKSVTGPGYNVNVVSNLKIGRYFDFRLLPGFSFTNRILEYADLSKENEITQLKVESVFTEIPFHVRFKSEPYNDMRIYVLAGVKYGYDIASKSRRTEEDRALKISPTDFSVEAGFGMQFFFPYFILSPELKFTQGLNNILIYNQTNLQSNILENVLSRTLTLSFHFEG